MLTSQQLLNITIDSASNNDALAYKLAKLMPSVFGRLKARIRCMDHVVNIAARRAMLMFDASAVELAKALDEAAADLERIGDDITDLEDSPQDEEDGDIESAELARDHNIEVELGGAFDGMSEEYKEELREQVEPMRESISKVRTSNRASDQALTAIPCAS